MNCCARFLFYNKFGSTRGPKVSRFGMEVSCTPVSYRAKNMHAIIEKGSKFLRFVFYGMRKHEIFYEPWLFSSEGLSCKQSDIEHSSSGENSTIICF